MDFEEPDEDAIASRDAEVLSALEQLGEDAPALRRRVVALTREHDTLRAQMGQHIGSRRAPVHWPGAG
ncbi:hypothetical protein G6F61_014997 [Rhizopus arrhizus]|nr:hypothetical protein G6F61_014997 [Rhizopus arrhizus]